MRILIDIGHPAHVHFFRGVMACLRNEGHEVRVAARDKDVTLRLLQLYGIEHVVLSRAARRPGGLYVEYVVHLLRLLRLARSWRPDVLIAIGGVFVAPAGRLSGVPALVFTDTEHVAMDRWLTYPIAAAVYTPYTFLTDAGPRQRRYKGLHELAYLDPRRFTPDAGIRSELGVRADEPYAIVRFVSWSAGHDRGHSGFRREHQEEAVRRLGARLRVFVSSERPIPPTLEQVALRLEPHRIHHALAGARLYIGDGATMATEAGLLGTPSLYVSSLVGTMGNFNVLQESGLVESFSAVPPALDRAERLLAAPAEDQRWKARARVFAESHVDVTDFVVREVTALASRRASPHLDP